MSLSFNRFVAALALAGAALGCSGGEDDDDSSSLSSGGGADDALAVPTCYMGLQVPGVTYDGHACSGSDTHTTVSGMTSGSGMTSSFAVAASVALDLDLPPALGLLSISSMTIDIPANGMSRRWNAPSSCTADAIDMATDPDFGWDYYRIDISCPEPALPVSGNTGEPLELGNFSIVTFFDP